MAFTNINIGAAPNDGTGDSLRVAGGVINANFAQAALDAAVVHLTGAETVAGVKTFSSIPVGPSTDPTTNDQLTRKLYVDTLDGANVKLTGAQTVAGVKTFSSIPVGPASDPTTDNQLARKKYVDDQVATKANDADVVKLTGAQTVAGVKTFSSIPVGPAADPTTANELTRKSYVDTLDGANVKLTGAQTVAGIKTFSSIPVGPASDPTTANQLTRKSYVDALVAAKADDSAVVKLTGDQTVAGIKTFSSIPVGPASDPTTDNQLTRKLYVDTLDGANVKLTGAQTIAGVKTFSSIPVGPASDPTTDNQLARKKYVDDLIAGVGGGGDMVLASAQTVTGNKTFDDLALLVANVNAAGFATRFRYNDASATANHIFQLNLNGANRTLNLSGNVTLGGSLTTGGTLTTGGAVSMEAGNYGVTNVVKAATTGNYTLVLGDAWQLVQFDLAVTRTLTVPTNATVAFAIGTEILVKVTATAASPTLNIAGAGVTFIGPVGTIVNSAGTATKTIILQKVATNTWFVLITGT